MLSFLPAPSLPWCRDQPGVAPGRLEDRQGDTSGWGRKSVLGTRSREGQASQERKVKVFWAVCAGSWRLNLQLHSTPWKLVRLLGYLGLLVVGCSPSSPAWEGEQRGGGVGVQPQGPGDLRSHRGSPSLPTSISHVLSFYTFWVMKMFYNWIVVMVTVTQLSTFTGNHQSLKNKQEIKGAVRQLSYAYNTLHNAEHWGCPQPPVWTYLLQSQAPCCARPAVPFLSQATSARGRHKCKAHLVPIQSYCLTSEQLRFLWIRLPRLLSLG